MKLGEWVDSVWGIAVDVDGTYGAQCVDLVNDYLTRVKGAGRMTGNAIDLPGQTLRGFTWVPNGRLNYPAPGDVVGWGLPPFGHVAVCLWASSLHLVTLDQNWDNVRHAAVVVHGYDNVLGWQHAR